MRNLTLALGLALAIPLSGCGGGGGEDSGILIRRPDNGPTDLGPLPPDNGPLDMGPPLCLGDPSPDVGIVVTESGSVQGVLDEDNGVWSFLGIPYAVPPTGENRFRNPQRRDCFDGTFDADQLGAVCPQFNGDGELIGDEDCLTLNVYSSDLEAPNPRPVIVWFHGGLNERGSAAGFPFDGSTFTLTNPRTVVVGVNYRLGPLGFLAHPALSEAGGDRNSGNYAALDQIAALRWVQNNIDSFGGDPERVFALGYGTGGSAVCRLVASPLADGLFSSAGIMSGPCVAKPLADAEAEGEVVATALGCGAGDTVGCLRGASLADVMGTLTPTEGDGTSSIAPPTYQGVIDGHVLTAAPRDVIEANEQNEVLYIIGSTLQPAGNDAPFINDANLIEQLNLFFEPRGGNYEELVTAAIREYPGAGFLNARQRYLAMTGDAKFTCQARRDARALSTSQGPEVVYWYQFGQAVQGAQAERALGAYHANDLRYLFGTLDEGLRGLQDRALIPIFQAYWARFAATNDPNGIGDPIWPALRVGNNERWQIIGGDGMTLVLDDERFDDGGRCEFWETNL